jgi:hypothetical protein
MLERAMDPDQIVLVDRDRRTRPRARWREAWDDADGHALSTLATRAYVLEAVRHGGLRAVTVPVTAFVLTILALFTAAFGAAVVAGGAEGGTRRALLVIGASVLVSQAVNAIQNRRPTRRLFIAASIRVTDQPLGWGIVWMTLPAATASGAKTLLLTRGFAYVEVTYYRNSPAATLAAYFSLDDHDEHALTLLGDALGRAPHTPTAVILNPRPGTAH